MGWMLAPIELSAINSMWVVAKRRINNISYQGGIFDFNVGFISTAILALVFLAFAALVQFGSGKVDHRFHRVYVHIWHNAHHYRRLCTH